MKAIHQFLAGFTSRDAISNEAIQMRDIFRSWGYESDIFSETHTTLPKFREQSHAAPDYATRAGSDDVVLLHLSIGSRVNDIFRDLPCKKAILYHNITPAAYLEFINKRMAYDLLRGREQVANLAGVAEVNMACSRFNAMELEEQGFSNVHVLPLVLDLGQSKIPPDKATLRMCNDGTVNILFVGRCVPNKALEDLLSAFFYFHKHVEPNSRLIHVGSHAGTDRYYYLLLGKARELGLSTVQFAGSVSQAALNAYYKSAHLFLCMSEHEGFCIPLIESMAHDLPILAYAAAAVPETMDGAGVLFSRKQFELVAEMMGMLVHDQPFRNGIIEGQRSRLSDYLARDLESELRQHLSPLLN